MADKQPSIAMNPVKSSNVNALGYDPATKRMAVQFKGGKTYHYHGVDAKTAEEVSTSQSIGSAVNSRQVKGGYKYERIEEDKQ